MNETTGLDGVVAARTRLSHVDGRAGVLLLHGRRVEEAAPRLRFCEMVSLLWDEEVTEERLRAGEPLAAGLPPPPAGLAMLSGRTDDPAALLGAVAALLAHGEGESLAARYLHGARGRPATPAEARALETYWNTVIDHGLNASTFTARVIASTGSDTVSALLGAWGALKGPLHGGAPGPALDALLRLRGPGLEARARDWARGVVRGGGRIMGFGHRVYKVRDPRADVLLGAARTLLRDSDLLADAEAFERAVLAVLEEEKPGRNLKTNVEFATALLLHGLGLPPERFTDTFAVARAAGWLAHVAEQREEGRLIRPTSEYIGSLPD